MSSRRFILSPSLSLSPVLLICCSTASDRVFFFPLSLSLFLSHHSGGTTPRVAPNPEVRPCRERKRRYSPVLLLVSLPSTPTMRTFLLVPFSSSLTWALGPVGRIAHSVSCRVKGAPQPGSSPPPPPSPSGSFLLPETNCSRVLQPFRGEGRAGVFTCAYPVELIPLDEGARAYNRVFVRSDRAFSTLENFSTERRLDVRRRH